MEREGSRKEGRRMEKGERPTQCRARESEQEREWKARGSGEAVVVWK